MSIVKEALVAAAGKFGLGLLKNVGTGIAGNAIVGRADKLGRRMATGPASAEKSASLVKSADHAIRKYEVQAAKAKEKADAAQTRHRNASDAMQVGQAMAQLHLELKSAPPGSVTARKLLTEKSKLQQAHDELDHSDPSTEVGLRDGIEDVVRPSLVKAAAAINPDVPEQVTPGISQGLLAGGMTSAVAKATQDAKAKPVDAKKARSAGEYMFGGVHGFKLKEPRKPKPVGDPQAGPDRGKTASYSFFDSLKMFAKDPLEQRILRLGDEIVGLGSHVVPSTSAWDMFQRFK